MKKFVIYTFVNGKRVDGPKLTQGALNKMLKAWERGQKEGKYETGLHFRG